MARVIGINAIILYANDPAALAEWYEKRLGITTIQNADDGNFYGEIDDYHTGLTTQFAIYQADRPLAPDARGVRVNYRVDDLDVFVRQLQAAGINFERIFSEDYGNFAHFRDPEGNPIELWAPRPPPNIDLRPPDHHHREPQGH
jgi:predicted enzyme related to lactoylglutathione lyase